MFSVCVPVYRENGAVRHIADQIRKTRLWRESEDKEMLFCVNGLAENGSDETLQTAHEIEKEDLHIKVITIREKGKNYSWNELVRRSNPKSHTLFFVDADVELHEDTLSRLNNELVKNEKIAVVGAYAQPLAETFPKTQPLRRRFLRRAIEQQSEQRFIHGRCYAIRRSEAEKIRMPKDQRIHEDTFLTLTFAGRFKILREAPVYYRMPSFPDMLRQEIRGAVSNRLLGKNPKTGKALEEYNRANPANTDRQTRGLLFAVLRNGRRALVNISAGLMFSRGSDTWPKMRSTAINKNSHK